MTAYSTNTILDERFSLMFFILTITIPEGSPFIVASFTFADNFLNKYPLRLYTSICEIVSPEIQITPHQALGWSCLGLHFPLEWW